MQSFISQFKRLYLAEGTVPPDMLEQRLLGHASAPLSLATPAGLIRAIVIDFRKQPDGGDAAHWSSLCALANTLQSDFGLPAPAVSISGDEGFQLWLSLEKPTSLGQAQAFVDLLRDTCMPGKPLRPLTAPVEVPPSLHPRTGKWAAFIHPGLGASFADESGLEMPPPLAGQLALLEGLHSVSAEQFAHALDILRSRAVASAPALAPRTPATPPATPPAGSTNAAPPAGLLLADATIEDIVRHLHAQHIEPTFRYLVPEK